MEIYRGEEATGFGRGGGLEQQQQQQQQQQQLQPGKGKGTERRRALGDISNNTAGKGKLQQKGQGKTSKKAAPSRLVFRDGGVAPAGPKQPSSAKAGTRPSWRLSVDVSAAEAEAEAEAEVQAQAEAEAQADAEAEENFDTCNRVRAPCQSPPFDGGIDIGKFLFDAEASLRRSRILDAQAAERALISAPLEAEDDGEDEDEADAEQVKLNLMQSAAEDEDEFMGALAPPKSFFAKQDLAIVDDDDEDDLDLSALVEDLDF